MCVNMVGAIYIEKIFVLLTYLEFSRYPVEIILFVIHFLAPQESESVQLFFKVLKRLHTFQFIVIHLNTE